MENSPFFIVLSYGLSVFLGPCCHSDLAGGPCHLPPSRKPTGPGVKNVVIGLVWASPWPRPCSCRHAARPRARASSPLELMAAPASQVLGKERSLGRA